MALFTRFADELRRTMFFTACIDVARRTLPAPALVWLRSQMVRNLHGGPHEVFTEIYPRNIWGYQETVSGGGSTLHYTKKLREALPDLIGDLNVRTLLDLPCGDFHWMSELNLPITRYIGSDIVLRLVEIARIRYGRPEREFRTLDLCKDVLPRADLLLCRDCLMHLSEEMNFLALANIIRSDIKYLLISTYPDGKNRSIRIGDWFPINLCAAPYNFPAPVRTIDDWVPPFDRRQLGLWEIESLRRICGEPDADSEMRLGCKLSHSGLDKIIDRLETGSGTKDNNCTCHNAARCAAALDFRFWQILLQKSKIERLRKPRESRFLDVSTAAKLRRADTKVRGRFCVKRCRPSRRRVRNVSAVY